MTERLASYPANQPVANAGSWVLALEPPVERNPRVICHGLQTQLIALGPAPLPHALYKLAECLHVSHLNCGGRVHASGGTNSDAGKKLRHPRCTAPGFFGSFALKSAGHVGWQP